MGKEKMEENTIPFDENAFICVSLDDLSDNEIRRIRERYPIDNLAQYAGKPFPDGWYNDVIDPDIFSKKTPNQLRIQCGLEPCEDEVYDMLWLKASECKRLLDHFRC